MFDAGGKPVEASAEETRNLEAGYKFLTGDAERPIARLEFQIVDAASKRRPLTHRRAGVRSIGWVHDRRFRQTSEDIVGCRYNDGLLNLSFDKFNDWLVWDQPGSGHLEQQLLVVAERFVALDVGEPELDEGRAYVLALPLDSSIGATQQ